MATSTIPAFTAALKAALEARAGLSGVHVTDGLPEPGIYDAEAWIALLGGEWEQRAATFPRSTGNRDERYGLKVLISVKQATRADQTTGVVRAFALLGEIEDAIRINADLTGFYDGPGQIVHAEIGEGELIKRADDQAREAAIEFAIRVRARI